MIIESVQDLDQLRESLRSRIDPEKIRVNVCAGTGCRACGAEEVVRAFREGIEKQGLTDKVDVKATGCHGFCERGALVILHPEGILYQKVRPADVDEIIAETVIKGEIVEGLLYRDPVSGKAIAHEKDIPFYQKQKRILLAMNSDIDPNSIEDYIIMGGYRALAKALTEMTCEDIIDEIKRSELRGRGGGGFPTGLKWETCRDALGESRYVICNADEGDPGAYMDRSLLEGNPHSVLEGMIIGAYAIGANEGYIYVRNEYPLAVESAKRAVEQAREYGLLGEDILSSGFGFDITVARGGGAFVCGESSALMASLEGRTGQPRAKYVHTVERGLREQPTNLNNVETWANVPFIVTKGSSWYREMGTKESKGTKIFSLVGKINNTGLVEVPMGMSMREIIYSVGGGIPSGKRLKAVQTGGPSGGCVPESMIDLPVDFDHLTAVGSMMGSGGMIVMDEDTCMVDVARYFLRFLKDESCGKCLPCREGIKQMVEILNRICDGEGKEDDMALLLEVADTLRETALCALGGSAPNPLISTIEHFRNEYEAHIKEKRCPAGVCKKLITYEVKAEECIGCGLCAKSCPQKAITGAKKAAHIIDQTKCVKCGACVEVCTQQAVAVN